MGFQGPIIQKTWKFPLKRVFSAGCCGGVGQAERPGCDRPKGILELAVELAEVVPAGVRSSVPRLGRLTRGGQGGAPRHLLAVPGGDRHCPCRIRRLYNTRVCGYCPAKPGSGHVVARRVGQLRLLLTDEAPDLGHICTGFRPEETAGTTDPPRSRPSTLLLTTGTLNVFLSTTF